MNIDEPEAVLYEAEHRVLEIQAKLHRWAVADPGRRFDDLFNLVADPAFLLVAWARVRGNKGARTAGVDGHTALSITALTGVEEYLDRLRALLKARTFRPLPVRERMIPKAGGKKRRLGIATITDRVVQASLKLVLEPIFEADFLPCSYGFRPNRRAHDAVAEVRFLTSRSYEWVVEGDIKACFDEISHPALLERVRARVEDKRVLALVKAFLKAGIRGENPVLRETSTGTDPARVDPVAVAQQRGPVRPGRAHRAQSRRPGCERLPALEAPFPGSAQLPAGQVRRRLVPDRRRKPGRRRGAPRPGRGCLVHDGPAPVRREDADHPHRAGTRLPRCWRIQRHRKRGTNRYYVYTYPAKKALASITEKVRTLCRQDVNPPLEVLLHQLNAAMRGWCNYFRPGVSSAAFGYLRAFVWRRVFGWLRRKHRRSTWKDLRRNYCDTGWWPRDGDVALFNPAAVRTTRYRYRGAVIPSPWPQAVTARA